MAGGGAGTPGGPNASGTYTIYSYILSKGNYLLQLVGASLAAGDQVTFNGEARTVDFVVNSSGKLSSGFSTNPSSSDQVTVVIAAELGGGGGGGGNGGGGGGGGGGGVSGSYLVTGYTASAKGISTLTVSGYTFNVYDAVTYGAETKYVTSYQLGTATAFEFNTAFATSPLGNNVTISTPASGTLVGYYPNAMGNCQIYIAGLTESGSNTLSLTYNGQTITGGTWVGYGTNSWVFLGQIFSSAPPQGTVLSYQYVAPAEPVVSTKPSLSQATRVAEANLLRSKEERVAEVNLVPAKETRVVEANLVPGSRDKTGLKN